MYWAQKVHHKDTKHTKDTVKRFPRSLTAGFSLPWHFIEISASSDLWVLGVFVVGSGFENH